MKLPQKAPLLLAKDSRIRVHRSNEAIIRAVLNRQKKVSVYRSKYGQQLSYLVLRGFAGSRTPQPATDRCNLLEASYGWHWKTARAKDKRVYSDVGAPWAEVDDGHIWGPRALRQVLVIEFGDESKIFVGNEGIPDPSKRSASALESSGPSCADINCVEGFAGWDRGIASMCALSVHGHIIVFNEDVLILCAHL